MATSRASPARAAVDLNFEELYRGLRADVYRAALRKLGNAQDAEDVTQAAFADAYRAVLRGARPQSPRAWLLAISENVRRRRFRTAQRRPREELVDDADFPLAAELPYEQSRALTEALATLPPEQRRVFVLREIVGLSYDEIAEELDSTVGSVQMLLFRARRSLRDVLDPPTVAIRRPVFLPPLPGWLAGLWSRIELATLTPRAAGTLGAAVAHRRRRQCRSARLAGGRAPDRARSAAAPNDASAAQPALGSARRCADGSRARSRRRSPLAPVRAQRKRSAGAHGRSRWPRSRRQRRPSPCPTPSRRRRADQPQPGARRPRCRASRSRSSVTEAVPAVQLPSAAGPAPASRADSRAVRRRPAPRPSRRAGPPVPVTPPALPPPVETATGAAGAAGASAPPLPVPCAASPDAAARAVARGPGTCSSRERAHPQGESPRRPRSFLAVYGLPVLIERSMHPGLALERVPARGRAGRDGRLHRQRRAARAAARGRRARAPERHAPAHDPLAPRPRRRRRRARRALRARDRQRPARDRRPHDRGARDSGPRRRPPRLRRERDRRLHGRHPLQGRRRRRARTRRRSGRR